MSTTVPGMAELTDCPECGSARSVERDLCQVCYAEFDEPGAADLPPAASTTFDSTLLTADVAKLVGP